MLYYLVVARLCNEAVRQDLITINSFLAFYASNSSPPSITSAMSTNHIREIHCCLAFLTTTPTTPPSSVLICRHNNGFFNSLLIVSFAYKFNFFQAPKRDVFGGGNRAFRPISAKREGCQSGLRQMPSRLAPRGDDVAHHTDLLSPFPRVFSRSSHVRSAEEGDCEGRTKGTKNDRKRNK